MERAVDLSDRNEVLTKVLEDWLLRELRDEIVSRITWRDPEAQAVANRIRVSYEAREPVDVYFLSPVGIGGKFFYEHPVGETFYSAEATVTVELEEGPVRSRLGQVRLFWVGSNDPKGYRISEGFETLLETVQAGLTQRVKAPITRRGFRSSH